MKTLILTLSILLFSSAYAQNTSESKKAEISKETGNLIALGDESYKTKDYERAKEYYLKALAIDPALVYPKDKISQIEDLVRDEKAKEEEIQYSKIIAAADAKFAEKNYQKAKEYYERALKFRPNDSYPKVKLEEIEQILVTVTENQKLELAYSKLLADADEAFLLKKYVAAKDYYIEAITIKPTEDYPKQRIVEIDSILYNESIRK